MCEACACLISFCTSLVLFLFLLFRWLKSYGKEARGADREWAHSDVERKVKEKGERSVRSVVRNDSLTVKLGIPEIRG